MCELCCLLIGTTITLLGHAKPRCARGRPSTAGTKRCLLCFARRGGPGCSERSGIGGPKRGPLVLAKGVLTNAPHRAVIDPVVVRDGDQVEGLQVITTPGHTPGHISVWDPVSHILFAGDALAVVDGAVRHMARPVTPDIESAKRSMLRVIDLAPAVICPGHRAPISPTASDLRRARRIVEEERWPVFG